MYLSILGLHIFYFFTLLFGEFTSAFKIALFDPPIQINLCMYVCNYWANHKCKLTTSLSQPYSNGIHGVVYLFFQTN